EFRGDAAAASASARLADTLGAWLDAVRADPPPLQAQKLTRLRDRLLGGLPPLLHRLNAALGAHRFGIDELPAEIRRDWVSADGRYRVEATPKENLNDDDALLRFVADVQAVAPEATGAPVDYVGGARA